MLKIVKGLTNFSDTIYLSFSDRVAKIIKSGYIETVTILSTEKRLGLEHITHQLTVTGL